MKKKVKRYQDGGVLRDRYGNPVRSGSGEVVRTRFPERTYNEQATADMTESSDYSGRRMKSPDVGDTESSDYMRSGRSTDIGFGGGEDEEPRSIRKYMKKLSEDETPSAEVVEEKKTITRKPAKKAPKRASQSFGVDESGMKERAKAASDFQPTPKSKFSDTGKSTRLRALLGTFGLKKGGTVSSASKRADGIAQRGKTRGKVC
jgi:hypothetical protein